MKSSLDSVGTNISAHLTDEATSLKVVEFTQFNCLLNLNLFFFDRLAIPIIGILNNPSFEFLISKDQTSASRLFKTDATGFIRPIVFRYDSDNKKVDFQEIVNKLLKRKQRIYLSKDKLCGMANFINEAEPEPIYARDAEFRSRYHRELMEITAFINQYGLQAGQSNVPLLPKNSLRKLNEWLRVTDAKICNCTGAFEIINGSTILNDYQKKEAKIVAAATWMYSIRGSMVGSLSVPSEYLPVIECFRKLGVSSDATILKDIKPIEFPISVPFGAISHLPLSAILELRDNDTFIDIRDILSKYRMSGENVSHEMIREAIDKCRDKLLDFERRCRRFCSQEGRDIWNQIIAELNKNEINDRLKIWRDRATGIFVFTHIIGTFCEPFRHVAAFIRGGHYLLDKHIERTEKVLSTSLAPEVEDDSIYDPVKSGISKKEVDGPDAD